MSIKPDRQYVEAWLRRTGRQLAVSGRITQLATVLSTENGGTLEHWRQVLHTLMEGRETPTIELITRIDALLAGPAKNPPPTAQQASFF